MILGQDFQKQLKFLLTEYTGYRPDLVISNPEPICSLSIASVDWPLPFPNLPPNCKPIPTKSQQFGKGDRDFSSK